MDVVLSNTAGYIFPQHELAVSLFPKTKLVDKIQGKKPLIRDPRPQADPIKVVGPACGGFRIIKGPDSDRYDPPGVLDKIFRAQSYLGSGFDIGFTIESFVDRAPPCPARIDKHVSVPVCAVYIKCKGERV